MYIIFNFQYGLTLFQHISTHTDAAEHTNLWVGRATSNNQSVHSLYLDRCSVTGIMNQHTIFIR